jgi:hypothetical protein
VHERHGMAPFDAAKEPQFKKSDYYAGCTKSR